MLLLLGDTSNGDGEEEKVEDDIEVVVVGLGIRELEDEVEGTIELEELPAQGYPPKVTKY